MSSTMLFGEHVHQTQCYYAEKNTFFGSRDRKRGAERCTRLNPRVTRVQERLQTQAAFATRDWRLLAAANHHAGERNKKREE